MNCVNPLHCIILIDENYILKRSLPCYTIMYEQIINNDFYRIRVWCK